MFLKQHKIKHICETTLYPMKYSPKILFFALCFFTTFVYGQRDPSAIVTLMVQKTNALRTAKGLAPLQPLDSLHRLAQFHSDNMAREGFYQHVDPQGRTPIDRAKELGIQPWRRVGNRSIGIGENIAQVPWFENVSTCGDTRSDEAFAECMVQGWKNSPPHYKNIMGDYKQLGIGLQFNKDNMGLGTQVFR